MAAIVEFFEYLNGDTTSLYVFLRAIILFVLSILLIRFGNRRFLLNTSMDLLFLVMFGSVVSRGINGTATLLATLVAMLALTISHKTLAKLTCKSKFLEKLFKGRSYTLIKKGRINHKTLKNLNISTQDLIEQLHQHTNTNDISIVEHAFLERTGNMSFICKQGKKK